MRILYATDGSPGAMAGAGLLEALPFDSDSRLTILTVTPPSEEVDPQQILAQTREALSHFTGGLTSMVRQGRPEEQNLLVAEEQSADLLALGTRGLSGLARFFLGSVAERMARHAPCPVLLARPPRDDVHLVIVGVDGSPQAIDAVEWLRG